MLFPRRGYVYDTETGLYYLQSRYYSPEWGRFINTDSYAVTDSESVLGVNSFAYCENNPVNHRDSEGTFLNTLIGGIVGGITAYRQWKQEQRNNPGASKETLKQAVTRGAVTGAVAGLALDISIATAGTGALAIAFLGGFIASGGNTAWKQYNNGEAIDWVGVGVDAAIGGGMNMLFGAYGRTPHRATGSSVKEIASAVSKNFKRSFSAPAGQWLPSKHARTWSLSVAEAFTASDFAGVFSGIFKQWVMFPE